MGDFITEFNGGLTIGGGWYQCGDCGSRHAIRCDDKGNVFPFDCYDSTPPVFRRKVVKLDSRRSGPQKLPVPERKTPQNECKIESDPGTESPDDLKPLRGDIGDFWEEATGQGATEKFEPCLRDSSFETWD